MTNKFQLNGRHQFKSMREGLILLSLAPIGILIGLLKFGAQDLPGLLTIFGLCNLLFLSPSIYLHITYLAANWDTKLVVNKEEFRIHEKNSEFIYRKEDIKSTELHLGIYYKNRIDNRGRWTTPWTSYGYLKLRLKDGKDFIFTSLMLDLDKLPFPVTVTRFRFTPYIDKNQIEYKDIKAHNERLKQEKIAEYQERFIGLSEDKLLEKINNPARFEFEARKAAENILEQRRKITTANSVHMPLPGQE